jgi:hypothetical protein
MNDKYINNIIFSILIGSLIIIISFFYFSFTSNNVIFGLLSDDAVYLLQAELYSPWHSGTSPAVDYIRERSLFPPLYPILLGILGADSGNLTLASNITISCLLISVFCIGFFTFTATNSKVIAIILSCTIAFLPDTLLFSQGLWSEFLFMCLIYAAFIFIDIDDTKSEYWLLTALVVSLASLTRSIGIALILALLILLFIKRPKFCLYYIFISCIPFFIWMLNRYILVGDTNYINSLFEKSNQFSILELIELLQQKLFIFAKTWGWFFSGYTSDNILVNSLIGIFFILALSGYYLRLIKFKLDAFFTPIYLLILIVWPYTGLFFTSRFVYPIFPLLLIYIIVAVQKLFSPIRYQYVSYIIVFSLIIITTASTSINYIKRGFLNIEPSLKPYTRTRHWLMTENYEMAHKSAITNKKIIESLLSIDRYVPKNECIYAIQTPFVMLYSQRKSVVFPPMNNSIEEFEKNTRACNYFIAMPMSGTMIKQPIYYPLEVVINNPGYKIIPIPLESNAGTEIILFLIKRI